MIWDVDSMGGKKHVFLLRVHEIRWIDLLFYLSIHLSIYPFILFAICRQIEMQYTRRKK